MNRLNVAPGDRCWRTTKVCWTSRASAGNGAPAAKPKKVPRILQKLQTIRMATLRLGPNADRPLMTQIPKNLNDQLQKLNLAALFAAPPKT